MQSGLAQLNTEPWESCFPLRDWPQQCPCMDTLELLGSPTVASLEGQWGETTWRQKNNFLLFLLVPVKPSRSGPGPCSCQGSPLAKKKVSLCQWAGLVARLHKRSLPGHCSSIISVLHAVLYDALYNSLPFLWCFPLFWYCLLQKLELTVNSLLTSLGWRPVAWQCTGSCI